MNATNHRLICDCSRPATVKLGTVSICSVCFSIDAARLRLARERRQKERREKLRARLDSFFGEGAEAFSSPLKHSH
jgi:hypothetical protein